MNSLSLSVKSLVPGLSIDLIELVGNGQHDYFLLLFRNYLKGRKDRYNLIYYNIDDVKLLIAYLMSKYEQSR